MRPFLVAILGGLLLAAGLLSAQPKTPGLRGVPVPAPQAEPTPVTKAPQADTRATVQMSDAMVILAPHLRVRTCMLQITPTGGDDILRKGHDQVDACSHEYGVDWTIKTVSCYANHGTPTVTLKLTGGNDTSIVAQPIPCGERTWMSGPVNGAPLLHSFSGLGSTCAQSPCSLEASVATVTGVSQWVVIRITGQL